ncbi:hypothetical protein Tco_0221520 [Tanacetum coccineum]
MTGPTHDLVTLVNQVARDDDNPNNPPSLQDQIMDHISLLKALIKQHKEKSGTLIESIRLTFSDNEEGDKAKTNGKITEEEKDEDLLKPYKEVLKSPFTKQIIEFSAPNHQIPTNLKIYDGSTDPENHITLSLKLAVPTRQILDSKGAIPTMTTANARIAIQQMAEHSQKWHDGTSTKTRNTETFDGFAAIQAQLNNLGRENKKVVNTNIRAKMIFIFNDLHVLIITNIMSY